MGLASIWILHLISQRWEWSGNRKANYLLYRLIYCTAKCLSDMKSNLRVGLIFPKDEAKSEEGLDLPSVLGVFLLSQEQELAGSRGSFVAGSWHFVSASSFKTLLTKPAFVPAVSPIIPTCYSFGILCHGDLLPPLLKSCIMWQTMSKKNMNSLRAGTVSSILSPRA